MLIRHTSARPKVSAATFLRRGRGAWLAVCGTLSLCSCTLPGLRTGGTAGQASLAAPERAPAIRALHETDSDEHPIAALRPSSPGRVRLENVASAPVSGSRIMQTSAIHGGIGPTGAIVQSPYCPRVPAMGMGPNCDPYAVGLVAECDGDSPVAYPDEYLFDGGDRGDPVHYSVTGLSGFESEDTIAEYADENSKQYLKKSNRVAVYAPRFGAVTTVSAPSADTGVNRAAGAVTTTRGVGVDTRLATVWHAQREGTERVQTRSRASGIEVDVRGHGVDQLDRQDINAITQNVFEDRGLQKGGQLLKADEARLALGIQAAQIWTRTEFPTIEAKVVSASETRTEMSIAEFVGRKSQAKPGVLQIIKTADKRTGQPGDVVTFTIIYENVGERPLHDIMISDSLTPRLEYIPESATSDRNGQLATEDNGEGSLILRWELDEPLPGKTRGTVGFQARIR